MKVLPNNILKCMSTKDRQECGQRTAEEVLAQGEATSEKMLQKQIVGLLRLKGIEPLTPAMHKRSTIAVGWPDITFAVCTHRSSFETFAVAWECKLPGRELTPEQHKMMCRLTSSPNFWRHRVIRSVDQALAELRSMGL